LQSSSARSWINSKLIARLSVSSLRQAPEVSKAINARAMSILPTRLQGIAANQIEADKLKAFVGVGDPALAGRNVAQHIRFATARRARTGATQHFEFEKRFGAIVPGDRKLVSDLLNIGRLQTHDVDLAPRSGGFPAAVGDLEIALPCSPFAKDRRADAHQRRTFLNSNRKVLRHAHRKLGEIDMKFRLEALAQLA